MALRSINHLLLPVAGYALYLIAFFVFGPEAFGPERYYWFSSGLSLAACFFAARLAFVRHSELRPFFRFLAVSLLLLAAQAAIYNQEALETSYGIVYTLFLFTWVAAWVLLAVQVIRAIAPLEAITKVLLLVLLCLAAVYLIYLTQIYPEDGAELDDLFVNLSEPGGAETIAARFRMVAATLDAVGLFFGLLVVILGVGSGYTLMVAGFAVLAGSDFVFLKLEDLHLAHEILALAPIWDLGVLLVLLGLLVLDRQARAATAELPGPIAGDSPGGRSALSALLASLTLGAIFVPAGAVFALENQPEWLLFIYLLFCVAWLLIIARLTLQFDRAVDFCAGWAKLLLSGGLAAPALEKPRGATLKLLQWTRLRSLLGALGEGAVELREKVLFLGPDRLYGRVPDRPAGRAARCFVVMPFSEPWSDEVHRLVRHACNDAGVRPIRGDDLFAPGNFVEDIWQKINEADFVIADLTGRNANVFYELGIAHTLAKPVLLLVQSADELPADLKTLRTLPYGEPAGESWRAAFAGKLGSAIGEVVEKYGFTTGPRSPGGREAEQD